MAFTNSPLATYVRISPSKNSPRNKPITKVTWHHIAGELSVETFGNIVANPDREMSATYAVGYDGRIGRYLEESDRPWTSCSPSNDNQAVTLEISNCENCEPWRVSDKVFNSAIDLTVDICKRNGIKQLTYTGDENGSLTFHRFFTSTSCLPVDRTELLTPTGWKFLKDIKIGDMVATVDQASSFIKFDNVENLVPESIQDTYTVNGFEATLDHRVMYYDQLSRQHVGTFNDIVFNQCGNVYLPNAGDYEEKGIPLSSLQIELLTLIQINNVLDKYIDVNNNMIPIITSSPCSITDVCTKLGYVYKFDSTTNMLIITVDDEFMGILSDYLNEDNSFSWELLEMQKQQAITFINNLCKYSTTASNSGYTSDVNMDFVQALAALNGIGTKVSKDNKHIEFKTNIRPLRDKCRKVRHDQVVSCVTVKSGFILIRQHGRTTITGNCPGTYLFSRANDICRLVNAKLGTRTNTASAPTQQTSSTFKVGALVSVTGNASYYDGGTVPSWVKSQKWYISYLSGDRAVLGKNQKGDQDIQSPISTKFLCMNGAASSTSTSNTLKAYTVQLRGVDTVFTDGTGSKSKGIIGGNGGVFTIVAEQTTNGVVYGKLKSGIGWVKVGQKPNVVKPDKTIHVGDSVVVLKNVQYTGETFALYTSHYKVLELNGDRAVISADGVNVTAAVNINNLRK